MPGEIIKKALLTGLGLALQTKDELETLAKEYVTKTELSENDGRKFVEDIMKRYESAKDSFEERVESVVKNMFAKTDIATREELNSLKDEIARLKSQLKPQGEADTEDSVEKKAKE